MDERLPYGRGFLNFPRDYRVKAVLQSRFCGLRGEKSEAELVLDALEHPLGAPPLRVAAEGKKRILVITSDHTRPVPSKITLPLILAELRRGSPQAEIVILVATGVHRGTTEAELREKFGEELLTKEMIRVHDAFARDKLTEKGVLPSGCRLSVNNLVDWADFVMAEGFIEPHFFAGFSGGRKSILPGIASAESIMENHCAKLIDDACSKTGVLRGNPIHEDMLCAAKRCGLSYILNVALDGEKKIVRAFAGDLEQAHDAGCRFVREMCGAAKVMGDIVVTTNGGYPLDQNVYQSVKSMTAAEGCVRPGGVIVCVSRCSDGSGGAGFFQWFRGKSPRQVLEEIRSIAPQDTRPDQWQAQILARVMLRASVVMVAERCAKEIILGMGMGYADSLESAMKQALALTGESREIVLIPDGVSIILE